MWLTGVVALPICIADESTQALGRLRDVTALALPQIVDLEQYPIDRLDQPAGRALVERARSALHAVGACDLPGFLRPEATTAAVESALSLHDAAYRTDQTHDIEFSGLAPESLATDDPRRVRIRSAKEGTAFDGIPADSPVRVLYESDELVRFVGAALEIEPLFRSDDPLGALNYMYYLPGDELGWHFDNADFVVTLMLQASEAGGVFEFAPMLRSRTPKRRRSASPARRHERSRPNDVRQPLAPSPSSEATGAPTGSPRSRAARCE